MLADSDADAPEANDIQIVENSETETVASKKAKAQRKKNKKIEQASQREAMKLAIKDSSGPSLRQVELDQINAVLKQESLKVKEILSDGNCLYRYYLQ